jgi:hypothetical protein
MERSGRKLPLHPPPKGHHRQPTCRADASNLLNGARSVVRWPCPNQPGQDHCDRPHRPYSPSAEGGKGRIPTIQYRVRVCALPLLWAEIWMARCTICTGPKAKKYYAPISHSQRRQNRASWVGLSLVRFGFVGFLAGSLLDVSRDLDPVARLWRLGITNLQ